MIGEIAGEPGHLPGLGKRTFAPHIRLETHVEKQIAQVQYVRSYCIPGAEGRNDLIDPDRPHPGLTWTSPGHHLGISDRR